MYEKQAYTSEQTKDYPMPRKHGHDETQGFGKRMAEFRKAAGYTQQQLADEIGMTRRMIAYYETEAGHPPTSFLIALARALNLTTDELLGISTPAAAKASLSSRLERRLRMIERLNPKPKQQILAFIDTVVSAERLKGKVGDHGQNEEDENEEVVMATEA
jgi:transcriptional regulator with XRE-family HTH domain